MCRRAVPPAPTFRGRRIGMEIKAAATWHASFKAGLLRFSEKNHPLQGKFVAYRGRPLQFEDGVSAIDYQQVGSVFAPVVDLCRNHCGR